MPLSAGDTEDGPPRVSAVMNDDPEEAQAEPLTVDVSLGPGEVALPTIAGKEAGVEEGKLLRLLAHSMCEAGLSYAMPQDLSMDTWALLDSWLTPMRKERMELSRRAEALVAETVQARLANGMFTEQRVTPASWPEGVFVGWRHAKNSLGQDVVQVVRINSGELPALDFVRERSKAIDKDVAAVARSLFDRVSK